MVGKVLGKRRELDPRERFDDNLTLAHHDGDFGVIKRIRVGKNRFILQKSKKSPADYEYK